MGKREGVSVLYVDPGGPYPDLVTDWWDEARNADLYAGPNPVVAHPPCGPYSRLRKFNKYQKPHHAILAVEFVRRWGGVLEHPAYSLLYDEIPLPKPGEPADSHGGFSIMVEQVRWGHLAKKPTWLYIVGCSRKSIEPLPPMRRHTHTCGARARHKWPGTPKGMGAANRRRTPRLFALWLLRLAEQCYVDPPLITIRI